MGDDGCDIVQTYERRLLVVAFQDGHLLVERGVAHGDFHQETVGLCLGQLVGALLFHGVLCRQDGVDVAHAVGSAVDGDLSLLHDLEECSLRLGRCAVDLVDEHDVGEYGPLVEIEGLRLHVEDGGAQDVAGHQVGRKLDAAEARVNEFGDQSRQQRLGDAGHALDEHVAVGDDGCQQQVDSLFLADDDAANAFLQLLDFLCNKSLVHITSKFNSFDDFVHVSDVARHVGGCEAPVVGGQPAQFVKEDGQLRFLLTCV